MTQETIDLIIEWFGHIQQMATDKKTFTGAVMDAQHCLDEIAALASNSKQFVKEYRDEQEPISDSELEKLAEESNPNNPHGDTYEVGQYFGFQDGFKAGFRKILRYVDRR